MLAIALLVALDGARAADLPPGAVARLGDTRWRAGGAVRALEFSPDGRVLHGWASGAGGKLRPVAWSSSGGLAVPFRDAPAPPNYAANAVPAVRLDGNRVLTAGPGNAARVWDADTRRELAELVGHRAAITAVAASADGRRLATGSADGSVRLWDAATFAPLTSPRGHTGPLRYARPSADNARVLTTAEDGTARVWDLAAGRELRAFAVSGPVDLSADGTGVVVRAGGAVIVRDVLTGLEVVPASMPAVPGPRGDEPGPSPDGRVTARVAPGGTIELVEAASGAVRRTFADPRGPERILGFTPDGARLLTAGADHTVLVWDVRLQSLPLPDAVKKETSAAKHWATMATGRADAAYRAMARFAAEPPAAVKMARLRLKPAAKGDAETAATRVADGRAVELLEALGTPEAIALLKELAAGDESAWRTRAARRALGRATDMVGPSGGH